MTYTYEVVSTGLLVDVQHAISEPARQTLFIDGEWHLVRRVISAPAPVHFKDGPSGGWSSTGYAKRPHERQAEQTLGRKLTKAAR